MPLAFCDSRTVEKEKDLVYSRLLYPPPGQPGHQVEGETFNVKHSEKHDWYYVPDMGPQEGALHFHSENNFFTNSDSLLQCYSSNAGTTIRILSRLIPLLLTLNTTERKTSLLANRSKFERWSSTLPRNRIGGMRCCLQKVETQLTIILQGERRDPSSPSSEERKGKLRKAFETISACFVYTFRDAAASIDVWSRCTHSTMSRTTLGIA